MERYYDNTIWARGWHQKYHPPAQGLRAKPEARGLRDGIFDATQGPIWYFYLLKLLILASILSNIFHRVYYMIIENAITLKLFREINSLFSNFFRKNVDLTEKMLIFLQN